MPDQRERVPEDKGWVLAGLAWIHHVSSVGFSHRDLHEFGDVQRKGEDCDRDNIDQESLGIGHCLKHMKIRIL